MGNDTEETLALIVSKNELRFIVKAGRRQLEAFDETWGDDAYAKRNGIPEDLLRTQREYRVDMEEFLERVDAELKAWVKEDMRSEWETTKGCRSV